MPTNSSTADGWDDYWRGARDAGTIVDGGVRHPAVRRFWIGRLSAFLADRPGPKVLDIGSGDGAVLEYLLAIDRDWIKHATCVDSSPAAIDSILRRYPQVTGMVADAKSISLATGSFDLVTSQFGVEYAGLEAIDEAARLVAPAGSLMLLLHMESGLMYRECHAALDAIRKTQESNFIPLALQMFDAGFDAVRGADRRPYDDAASRLDPAVGIVEAVLADHGEHVAGDTIATLYSGISRIHRELPSYEPGTVVEWLQVMDRELESFARRMQSMIEAAVDAEAYRGICERLSSRGFDIESDFRLATDDGTPLGWILSATARAADS